MSADWIADKLWLGSFPDACPPGVDVVFLCAKELQNMGNEYDCEVVRVPLDDAAPTAREVQFALEAAKQVNVFRKQGKRVLVTCAQGVNRSALVVALALMRHGWSADDAIDHIRERRHPDCLLQPLSNKHFVRLLRQMRGVAVPSHLSRGHA